MSNTQVIIKLCLMMWHKMYSAYHLNIAMFLIYFEFYIFDLLARFVLETAFIAMEAAATITKGADSVNEYYFISALRYCADIISMS